ncbi:MAG: hypothetical protein EOP10_14885 [Proteobacteria bacterium]|nr:MAG: hypothetical protein EOP10_14885 [Pseudomonadota bacterium]
MLSKIITVIAFAGLSTSACFQTPIASVGSVTGNRNTATALSGTDAKSVTTIQANATENVMLSAPNLGGMQGAGVTIQPGTLGVSVNLVIEQAADLGDSDMATEIGLADDISVSSSTPGMIIRPSENADLKKPLSISMPLPVTAGLHLAGSKFVIFYKYFDPSEQKLITGIKVVDGVQAKLSYDDVNGRDLIAFEGYFGAYWAAILNREVISSEIPAPKPAEQPILNKALTAVVATTGILSEKAIVKNEAIPVLVWKKPELVFNEASRSVLLSGVSPDGQSVSGCRADLYESATVQSGIVLDASAGLRVEYGIKIAKASNLIGRFRCVDSLARVTISPWSDSVAISAAAAPAAPLPVIVKEPGVDVTNADIISISGVLNPRRDLLLFTLNPGDSQPISRRLPVDETGYFEFKVDRGNSLAVDLSIKLNATPILRDAAFISQMAAYFGETEARVVTFTQGQTDVELRQDMIEDLNLRIAEGQMISLVSFTSAAGNFAAEGESFKNIGLPLAVGSGVFSIPTRSMKGHLRLGTITFDARKDAFAQLNAGNALSDTPAFLNGLAAFGKTSDSLKNRYLNGDWRANVSFMWKVSNTLNNVANTYIDPSALIYKGYNFFTHNDDPGFTFDTLCGTGKKAASFEAPATVVSLYLGTPSNFTNFNNASAYFTGTAPDRTCGSPGFQVREEGARIGFNFASGIPLIGHVPAGVWRLKYDNAQLAAFDFSGFRPLDDTTKPKIPVPNIKFIKSGATYTGATIKFSTYAGGSYAPLNDLSYMKRLLHQATVSLWGSGNEYREQAIFVNGSSELSVTFSSPISDSAVSFGAFEYDLGDQTYRFEVGS